MRFPGFAALIFLFNGISPAQLTGTATLSGKVLNAQSNAPIAKATVTLTLETTPSAAAIALTDAVGDFTFDNLPAGDYRVSAVKTGFRPMFYGARSTPQPGAFIKLEEGARKSEIIIYLPLSSSISGLLVDSDGDPIVATDVGLYRLTTRDGRPASQQQGGAQSDERGAYRFEVTQPGRYCISANMNPSRGFAYYNNTGKLPVVTLPVLYPAGCGAESGRAIDIAAGGRIANLDIVVPSALAARHKGRIVTPQNFDRSTPIQVMFSSASDLFPRRFMMGFGVMPSGDIIGGAMIPGEYTITASYEVAGVKYSATTRVDFAPGEVKEFTITPRPTFTIPCKVTIEKPKTDTPSPLTFYLDSPNRMTMGANSVTWQPGKDCRLTDVSSGRWRLNLNLGTTDLYVKSARLGSLDILYKEFDLQDAPAGELAIVLSGTGAEITGEIDPASDGAAIVIAPAVHTDESAYLYRLQFTKPGGSFRVPSLPPGQYKLYAFEYLDSEQWQSPAYLARFQDAAKLIRVAEGDKLAIKLTRIPAN